MIIFCYLRDSASPWRVIISCVLKNFYYVISWLFPWKNADSLRQQNKYHRHFSDCLIIYFTNICSGIRSTKWFFKIFPYLQLTMSSGTKNMLVQGLGVLTFWGNRVHEASGPACGRWYIEDPLMKSTPPSGCSIKGFVPHISTGKVGPKKHTN